MKSTTKQSNKRAAFTIVELLTVMSIIVILIGLLVPALNQVKKFASEVRQKAQLSSIATAIELFNSEFDGYPEFTYLPGSFDTYHYPNDQQAGYLWYHDHAPGIQRLNVYMGLAGLYFVRDDVEDALNLPVCALPGACYEVPLVLQDRKFNPDGTLNYPAEWRDHWFGDKVLVNGKVELRGC